jgi:hypothetical protein
MDMRNLTSDPRFRGKVVAKQRTYYVLEGKNCFYVISFSPATLDARTFEIVDVSAANHVASTFAGRKGITAKGVAMASGSLQYLATPLSALNVLCVLVATKRAVVDGRYRGKELHFNVR